MTATPCSLGEPVAGVKEISRLATLWVLQWNSMDTAGLHLRCDGRAIECGQTHGTKSLLAKYWGGHDTVVPPFLLPSNLSDTSSGDNVSPRVLTLTKSLLNLSIPHPFS